MEGVALMSRRSVVERERKVYERQIACAGGPMTENYQKGTAEILER